MTTRRGETGAPATRARLIAAFAVVYVLWGSTYLAIRIAIETIPPFLMASARFLVAGAMLYLWSRARGAVRPSLTHWRAAAIVGALLLLGGNGAVVWAEQFVPSGLAALLVATAALWMVMLDWLRPGGTRPATRVWIGIALGLAGLAWLVGPSSLGDGRVSMVGAGVLWLGSLSWAMGSVYARRAPLPESALLANGMEMFTGGVLLALLAAATGEPSRFDPSGISMRSALAVLYLLIAGSLIGFTVYIWLVKHAAPAMVGTYAYVNPVVAVLLGWTIADEPITSRTLVAGVVILVSVAIITSAPSARSEDAGRVVPAQRRLAEEGG